MKFVIQRVSEASVTVNGKITGKTGPGFLALIGICRDDTRHTADKMLKKMLGLRIFEDSEGKTNLSLADVSGSLLLVSQFTLYADCKKGNRPSFINAAPPELAEELYDYIIEECRSSLGDDRVGTGIFGEMMEVKLLNQGPFTIILDSADICGQL